MILVSCELRLWCSACDPRAARITTLFVAHSETECRWLARQAGWVFAVCGRVCCPTCNDNQK